MTGSAQPAASAGAADGAVRSGGLTLSQHEWVQWIPADGDTTFEDNIWTVLPGGDAPLGRVVEAVRDVLVRHEGLRSLVERAEGRQHVLPADERLGEIVRITGADPLLDEKWRRTCFRVGEQWPIEIVLSAAGRTVSQVGVVVDHVAIDPWGMDVLRRDLMQAIEARATGLEPFGGRPPEQPLDVAQAEGSEPGLSYQRRALTHWDGQLRRVAAALAGRAPSIRPAAKPGGARFHSARLVSRTAARAAGVLSRATGASAASCFLLAFGAAVCEAEQSAAAGLFAISANRTTARAAESVRKATMTMPIFIPAARASFRSALANCAAQQLTGHRFANADPRVTERMCHDILGEHYETAVAYPRFSYLAANAPGAPALNPADHSAPDGTVTFGEPRSLGARFMLTVTQSRTSAQLDLEWSDESGWGAAAEAMLLQIEAMLLREAAAL